MNWNNQEETNQYYRDYRKKNGDRLRQYDKENRPRRKENINKNKRKWYSTHKKQISERNEKYRLGRRTQLMNFLCNGNICCQKCSYKEDIRVLHLDHIENDGYLERKKFKHIGTLYAYYYKNPQIAKQKLQVLCANCNWLKRYEP